MISKILMFAMVAATHAMKCGDAKSAYQRGSMMEGACCPGGNDDAFLTPKMGGCGVMTVIEEFTAVNNSVAQSICTDLNVMAGANLAPGGTPGDPNSDFTGLKAAFEMSKYLRFELYAHGNTCTCIRVFEDASNATILAYGNVLMNQGATGFLAPLNATGQYDATAVDDVTGFAHFPKLCGMGKQMGMLTTTHKWFISNGMNETTFKATVQELTPQVHHFLTTDYGPNTPNPTRLTGPTNIGWEVYTKTANVPPNPQSPAGLIMGHDNRC